MKANKKMIRLANKIYENLSDYSVLMAEAGCSEDEFIYIKNDVTGELITYSVSVDAAKKHIPFLK